MLVGLAVTWTEGGPLDGISLTELLQTGCYGTDGEWKSHRPPELSTEDIFQTDNTCSEMIQQTPELSRSSEEFHPNHKATYWPNVGDLL